MAFARIHHILEATDLSAYLAAEGKTPARPGDVVHRKMSDGTTSIEAVNNDGDLVVVYRIAASALTAVGQLAVDQSGALTFAGEAVESGADLSNYVTQSALNDVAATIPAPVDLTPFATKTELQAVEDAIPPAVDITPLATKAELQAVEDAIPETVDLTPLATKAELQAVQDTIPAPVDLTGYALQSDLNAATSSLANALARIEALENGAPVDPVEPVANKITGFGSATTGGAGGQIVQVTSLSDDAAVTGSLRWAQPS